RLDHALEEPLGLALGERVEQRLARREVAVERAARDAGALAHVAHRELGETVARHRAHRALQNAGPRRGLVRVPAASILNGELDGEGLAHRRIGTDRTDFVNLFYRSAGPTSSTRPQSRAVAASSRVPVRASHAVR